MFTNKAKLSNSFAYAAPGIKRPKFEDLVEKHSPGAKDINSEQVSEIIKTAIEDHFKVPFHLIKADTRKRRVSFPRQISMYLHVKKTRYTKRMIGKLHGGRDHTTVIHSEDVIKGFLDCSINSFEKTEILSFMSKYGF